MKENDPKTDQQIGVDRDLISMFLRMSPEERIHTNDNSMWAILDLRDALREKATRSSKPQRPAQGTQ